MFKKHAARLVSVILMVLVSVGFCSGFGMATENLDKCLDILYRDGNVSDFIVKDITGKGFSPDVTGALETRYGAENVLVGGSLEIKDGVFDVAGTPLESLNPEIKITGLHDGITRLCFFDAPLETLSVNILENTATFAATDAEHVAFAERKTDSLISFAEGDGFGIEVKLAFLNLKYDFTFGGAVKNPLHFIEQADPSLQFEGENLVDIVYITDFPQLTSLFRNDIYISLGSSYEVMSNSYKAEVDEQKEYLEELLGDDAVILTLFENYSFASLHSLSDKVRWLAYIVMVMFLVVTLLVVLSTMTRLLDEERNIIACLSTLGYSPIRIIAKYLLFAAVGMAIGAFGAFYAGQGVSYLVYLNFYWMYALPAYPAKFSTLFFAVVTAVICLGTLLATLFGGLAKTRLAPAVLLRPKAPKPGNRLLLEKIPFLWKKISFKYKSMLRNLFRYKLRFFMTIVAVMCSTALIFLGFAILDCCIFQNVGSDAMIGMSVIILVFAILLDAVVIYTLTTINVSERERELATLMVLGYKDFEVIMYIFREIFFTAFLAVILGLPLGCLLCELVFDVLNFGAVSSIALFVYLASPALSALFTVIISLMLTPKIRKTDMNGSLKANE